MNNFYKENKVTFQLSKLAFFFIAIFAFYIQFHGKVSPGGGFQSGITLAILFIIYELLFYTIDQNPKKQIKDIVFIILATSGVLIYAFTGFACFLFLGSLFDYSFLNKNSILGQQIGIFCIESGVGLAVFGSMMTIYRSLLREVILSKN